LPRAGRSTNRASARAAVTAPCHRAVRGVRPYRPGHRCCPRCAAFTARATAAACRAAATARVPPLSDSASLPQRDAVRIDHGHGPDLVGTARIRHRELSGNLVNLLARLAVHDVEAQ
jgi:hypothetical protein